MRAGLIGLAALAACGPPAPGPLRDFTPVVWKQATPAATRADDLGACELQVAGVSGSMSQAQIRAASVATDARVRLERLTACLRGRGYTVTEGAICTPEERAAGRLVILSATDALPPLSRVVCHAPEVGGFVL
ncbi:hypothetical protein HMH01_16080 [Halovulum dunhuangense]|uniref:Uncharacterized protein n=1 Tax=Halovulum dunhuangense TaxID=1505036 RepID=A0A849L6D8_9RHOB|nr:hypothetical protein [Halovulum dunhuangense]NNU81956.1 hypothetical protein [Halovulum dunhuangense]